MIKDDEITTSINHGVINDDEITTYINHGVIKDDEITTYINNGVIKDDAYCGVIAQTRGWTDGRSSDTVGGTETR